MVSASKSAPTPDGKSPRPHCPRCGHGRSVHKWKFWKEHNEYVYHCSFMHPRNETTGVGRMLCGNMWRESRRNMHCTTCWLPLNVEQHQGMLGYWCSFCQDFSH